MYLSITKENITLSVSALWDGEADIYDPNIKAIQIGVGVTNKSREDLQINKIILRVRKKVSLFFSYDDLIINDSPLLIKGNSRSDFIYDLKPILHSYGDQRKINIRVIIGKTKLESEPISIKEMHKSIVALYARHF